MYLCCRWILLESLTSGKGLAISHMDCQGAFETKQFISSLVSMYKARQIILEKNTFRTERNFFTSNSQKV